VNNAVTGEPIRRALVQMNGQVQASALTGPDGRFRFDDFPEGRVMFFLQKPGFFDSRSLQTSEWMPQNNLSFTIGSGSNDFQLKLYPSARIIGHVTDSSGEPVENVQVQVIAEQIIQGRKLWQYRNASTTDDNGAFRIDELTPGHYVVYSAGHVLPAMSWNAPPEVIPPIYYPDAADLTSAQAVDLQPGQEFPANFHPHTERGYSVVAQVGGIPSNAFIGLSLENATGQMASFDGMRFDQKRGQVIVPAIPSGTWTLILSAWDRQEHPYEARQEIRVDHADVTGLQLMMHSNSPIPVTVNHAASQATQTVEIQPAGRTLINPNVQASLIPVEASRGNYQFTAGFQGDPPVYAFPTVPSGRYKLDVQGFGNECLESATSGGIDLTRDYLVVGAEGETQPVTINMRADCPTLSVKVNSGERTSGTVYVLLVPTSSFVQPRVQPISAPQAGSGNLPTSLSFTLSPGSYQVFAFSNLDGLEYANPEVLKTYPSQTVNLDAGQKADLTVELTERKGN
jgi:hypothetical protein